jgi:hypothetical protein
MAAILAEARVHFSNPMPVLSWLLRVLSATFWFAVNLAVVTALFFLSANLATQPEADARNGALFFRAIASIWLYIAAWTWLVRGVFQRPPPPAKKGKVTGTEILKGLPGCVANLVPIPLLFVFVGRWVDWAWAGMRGDDTRHPARRVADRALGDAGYALDHVGDWLPWVIGGLVFFSIASNVVSASRKQKKDAPRSSGVQNANEATLRKLRSKGKRPAQPGASGSREREILAPAGAASAAKVGEAHDGAHGTTGARGRSGQGREDRVLGVLTYSSSDGGWWAHRDDRDFAVKIAGDAQGADPAALDTARQAIQRSFEVLLRASEPAQRAAQGRGVGLPRFRIAALDVGSGSPPVVTLHLRCDADRGHEYRVQSTDGLHTYTMR